MGCLPLLVTLVECISPVAHVQWLHHLLLSLCWLATHIGFGLMLVFQMCCLLDCVHGGSVLPVGFEYTFLNLWFQRFWYDALFSTTRLGSLQFSKRSIDLCHDSFCACTKRFQRPHPCLKEIGVRLFLGVHCTALLQKQNLRRESPCFS